jgi:hypothetical protein
MVLMSSRVSKAMLTAHITFSVGWIGTITAFLALAIIGLAGNGQIVKSSYIAMELIAWFVIVPFCFASFLSGLIQGLGTHWGLFKYWWTVVKLILTVIATFVLMLHMQPISYLGEVAMQNALNLEELRSLRIRILADAGAAIIVLLAITTISVYKPWGKMQFGITLPTFKPTTNRPLGMYLLLGFLAVLVMFIVLHLFKNGIRH